MKSSKLLSLFIILSGIIGVVVGFGLLFDPIKFLTSSKIDLANDINLLSEIRASGGLLLSAAVIIIIGGFKKQYNCLALFLVCLFYLSYGVSRVIAIIFDGFPANEILVIGGVELFVGLISLMLLIRVKSNS